MIRVGTVRGPFKERTSPPVEMGASLPSLSVKPEKGDLVVPGYETINVLMKSHSKWGALGPYHLKTDEGWIFENVWQFAKIYEYLPYSRQV